MRARQRSSVLAVLLMVTGGARTASQGRQDATLARIFTAIGTSNRFFVEFGFNSPAYEGGSGANTESLYANGWRGLLLDGRHSNATINLHQTYIMSTNIVGTLQKHNVPIELDYLSIDIDSADLWVMRAILSVYRPRVISVEFNSNYESVGALASDLTFPDPSTMRVRASHASWNGTCYYGASAKALTSVARAHSYVLVDVDTPYDLFFVRTDQWKDRSHIDETTNSRLLHVLPNHPPMTPAEARNLLDYDVFVRTGSLCEARAAAAAQLRKYAAMHTKQSAECMGGNSRGSTSKCERWWRYRCFQLLSRLPEPWCHTQRTRYDASASRSPRTPEASASVELKPPYPIGSCQGHEVCNGLLACSWPSRHRVGGFYPTTVAIGAPKLRPGTLNCGPECGCQSDPWPTRQCTNILVPSRNETVGWSSRFITAIAFAPWAMVNGWGFQFSSSVCATEDRGRAHCFFRPASACGSKAHVVEDYGDSRMSNRERDVRRACRMAAAALAIDGKCQTSALRRWQVVAKLMARLQPDVSERIESTYLRRADVLSWTQGTYAALHIRRGDKILETSYQDECRYADRLASMCRDQCTGLKVFLATDDLRTLPRFLNCDQTRSHGWTVNHFSSDPDRGEERRVTDRIYAEVLLMARANWTVGTFTSNVGRVVQMLRIDKEEGTMQSLDVPWFSGWPPPWRHSPNGTITFRNQFS